MNSLFGARSSSLHLARPHELVFELLTFFPRQATLRNIPGHAQYTSLPTGFVQYSVRFDLDRHLGGIAADQIHFKMAEPAGLQNSLLELSTLVGITAYFCYEAFADQFVRTAVIQQTGAGRTDLADNAMRVNPEIHVRNVLEDGAVTQFA